MGRRAAFHTLGCKVNAYETEAMEELLQTAGYDIVPFTEQADVYVLIPAQLQIWRSENQDRCCTAQKN